MEEKKTMKEKLEEMKKWLWYKYDDGKRWVIRNKEALVIVAPVLISGVVEIVKVSTKRGNIREERRLKDMYIYDSSNRHYYELRRKLKSKEWIQIDERRSHGEPLYQILQDMRVLK